MHPARTMTLAPTRISALPRLRPVPAAALILVVIGILPL